MGKSVVALVALVLSGATALGAQVRVRQGTTELIVDPLLGVSPVTGYYAYDTSQMSSAFTGLETQDTSLLFLYQQSAGALSLVVIHDLYQDDSGGQAIFRFTGLPAGVAFAVRDDPPGRNGADVYAPDPPVAGQTTVEWTWATCCTDGAALDGFEGHDFCVRVDPQFLAGIDSWQVLSGPSLNPTRTTLPSLANDVVLCRGCQTLTCPDTITAECDGAGSAFVNLQASGASLCGGDSVTNDRTGGGEDASDLYPVGTTDVVFTLHDLAGFETTCESHVVVEDNVAPVIVHCPDPLDLPCDGQPVLVTDPRVQAWLASFTATDTCSTVALSNDAPAAFPPSCTGAGTVVHFTATDLSGNAVTCESSVTVLDRDPPVVTGCPAPVTIECDDPLGVPRDDPRLDPFYAGFTATDDCGSVTAGNDAPDPFPSDCAPGATTTVVFTATDLCGRTATCSSSVTVADTTPPDVTCPPDIARECSVFGGVPASPDLDMWRQSVATSDACGAASATDDLPPLVPSGCVPGQETQVTFTASDGCALTTTCTSVVTVTDTLPPAITTCPPGLTLECTGTAGVPASDPQVQDWLATFAAADVCSVVSLGNDAPPAFPFDCDPGAPTTVEFTATDTCANAVSCSSVLRVRDTTAPVIDHCPAPLTLECNGPGGIDRSDPAVQAWLQSFSATDLCGAATTSNDAPPFFPASCAGTTITVHFEAVDGCDNLASCSSTLTVRDTSAPVIDFCPAPLALECSGPGGIPGSDPRIQAWLASFAATDVCGQATLSNDAPGFFASGCGGNPTTVHFHAVDGCGNESVCESTVTVGDTMPPVFSVVPPPLTLECNGPGGVPGNDPAVLDWLALVRAVDVCDGASIGDDTPPLLPSGCAPGRVTDIAFTATDNCGNSAQAHSSITVRDTTPPVVSGCTLRPAAAPRPPGSLGDIHPPLPPRPPSSACSGASSAWVTVDCGVASDACDPDLLTVARMVLERYDVSDEGQCILRHDEVPVDCGELLELVRLAPPCAARAPRSPSPPVSVRSDGLRVLRAERMRLEVRATDGCGNVSDACVHDPTAPGGAIPCPPRPPRCPSSLCGELP